MGQTTILVFPGLKSVLSYAGQFTLNLPPSFTPFCLAGFFASPGGSSLHIFSYSIFPSFTALLNGSISTVSSQISSFREVSHISRFIYILFKISHINFFCVKKFKGFFIVKRKLKMTHNFLSLIIFFNIKSHACILLEKSDSTKGTKKNTKASSLLHPPLPFFLFQLKYN